MIQDNLVLIAAIRNRFAHVDSCPFHMVFSRHGYGIAWISDRLTELPHETLSGGSARNWESGTRDTGAFATTSNVVEYFDWLGGEVSDETEPRQRIEAAGRAIHAYETHLTNALISGTANLPDCLRISMCHYNTTDEVARTLSAIREIISRKSQVAL